MDANEMNLSLNGCGYLGIYHVGVCSCIKKYYPQVLKNKISGGSVGALVACAFMCDVPLATCAKYVFDVSMQVRNGILGPMSPDLDIMRLLRDSMDAMLPHDAHRHCDGRLHVSVTRFDDVRNVLLDTFADRDELLQALMCSCFIPVYCGYEPPEFHGVAYVDAGLSNNNPWLNKHTVCVAPFSGDSDICPEKICPEKDGIIPKTFTLSNTSIGLSRKNMWMLFRVLFPADPDIQREICQKGYNDALRYLRDKGMLPCPDCASRDRKRTNHRSCLPPEEELPQEISEEIMKAVIEFRKNLGYRLFQYRSMKILYYLNMPSIFTAKVVYLVISTIVQKVQSRAVPKVDDLWTQFSKILREGLYLPKSRRRLLSQDSDSTPIFTEDFSTNTRTFLPNDSMSSSSSSLSDDEHKHLDAVHGKIFESSENPTSQGISLDDCLGNIQPSCHTTSNDCNVNSKNTSETCIC